MLQFKDENKLDELFRALFIKQCNKLHEILPELFRGVGAYPGVVVGLLVRQKDGMVYHPGPLIFGERLRYFPH